MNIINFKTFADQDGQLTPISLSNVISFVPKRIFYIKNTPPGMTRGKHAHYESQQLLVCVSGKVMIKLHDGEKWTEFYLKEDMGVLVPKLTWGEETFLTPNDILMVVCSDEYDRDDYIEDFDLFLEITGKRND